MSRIRIVEKNLNSEENECIVCFETDKNETQSHNEEDNSASDSNSSSHYEDPNDETYIPPDSFVEKEKYITTVQILSLFYALIQNLQ